MKRLIMCLSIAALSVTGIYAQDKGQNKQQQDQDLRAYQQKQEKELQDAIRSQKEHYIMEATKTMDTKKTEAKNDLESRRSQLMHRPEGMVPYRGN